MHGDLDMAISPCMGADVNWFVETEVPLQAKAVALKRNGFL
jgi:hypothetical protein